MTYIYIRRNFNWDAHQLLKLGVTNNIKDRENTYKTSEIKLGYYVAVYEIPYEMRQEVDKKLKEVFKEYNVYDDGGTEFYTFDIIDKIKEHLPEGHIQLDDEEIANIQGKVYERPKTKWSIRKYQQDAIDYCTKELQENKKVFLELATGAGKTYIVYMASLNISPDIIIALSPRKEINKQNASDKYMNLLGNEYEPYNLSESRNWMKHIKTYNKSLIVGCYQSYDKIERLLQVTKDRNIFIWYDEAHWGDQYDMINRIRDYTNIYKLCTSASPNRKEVQQNENIYGRYYCPISVSELIEQKHLSPMVPYVYSRHSEESVDIVSYNIEHFKRHKTKYGFSFHSVCDNAYQMFKIHYDLFKSDKTTTKPFLLVSKTYEDIDLDYRYDNSKVFERTPYSMAYVVQQYSMGYDFPQLDYIIISDPKLSYADIIQSIGRGTRYIENKKLYLMLPTYDDGKSNPYEQVVEVLRFLIYNVGIKYDDIRFRNRHKKKVKEKTEIGGRDYSGVVDDMKADILKLIRDKNERWTEKRFIKYLQDKDIHNTEEYVKHIESNQELSLPSQSDELFTKLIWLDSYVVCPYYDKETCKKRIKELKKIDQELKQIIRERRDKNIIKQLSRLDPKIPNMNLRYFYGNDNFY